MYNPFDFTGKTIVLTGAAGGLGRPISIAFAKAGGRVVLFDLNEEQLTNVVKEICADGFVSAAKVDLCSLKEVTDSIARVLERFQQIDVLVNVVGGIIRKPALDYTIDEWQRVVDMNLKACWVCCQTVGKIMVQQKQGRIVNFSSNAGLHGLPNYPAYGPAKAGVIALTKVLAVEWGLHGVSTNAIAPGFVKTPINDEFLNNPRIMERFLMRMPFGEVLPPDALVGPTLFLASEAARWINGHTLHVDTGYDIT
jgi:NAD(P)-dependent dehydrogenase (short-subunit alcohol dehydrogenase family)